MAAKQNVLLKKYIYGTGIDEPICMIDVAGGNAIYYYHFDGLGSVVALSNNSGNVIEKYSYSVFGTPTIRDAYGSVVSVSSVANRFMFTGREYDTETGNYYYRARYYKPSIGRFLQTDPIGYADSMNLYQYCLNNPVNWIDPWGLFRFGKRPLKGLPWIPGGSKNPIDDYFNTELSHEHGFFEDSTGGNIGFGPEGRFTEDPAGKGYRYDDTYYDDALMREAIENLKDGKYSNWPWNKNNCQDWAERLREEYKRLKKEKEEKKKGER